MAKNTPNRPPPVRYHVAERGDEVLIENLSTGEAVTVKKADDMVRQALECNLAAIEAAAAASKPPAPPAETNENSNKNNSATNS